MILLTFDIEEFDVPSEYGKDILFEEQIEVSKRGTIIILDILKEYNIQATFFCTVIFAQNAPAIIKRIIDEGHELASHGWSHSKFNIEDLKKSKLYLESTFNIKIRGFRMARMSNINDIEVQQAGYLYNSSLNPTYIPGRYNGLSKSRTYFYKNNIFQIPASVTPLIRFPLFWLSFHNLPFWLYQKLSLYTLSKDQYLHLYFHPWEFMDLEKNEYRLPKYISRNSGDKMIIRFKKYLNMLLEYQFVFLTISDFKDNFVLKNSWYDYWNKVNSEFDAMMQISTVYFFKKFKQYNYIDKNDVILDYGCGSGILINQLKNECERVIGVDISSIYIEKCKTIFYSSKNVSIYNTLNFKDLEAVLLQNSINKIVVLSVIQYFVSKNQFLSFLDIFSKYSKDNNKKITVFIADIIPEKHFILRDALEIFWHSLRNKYLLRYLIFLYNYWKESIKNTKRKILKIDYQFLEKYSKINNITIRKTERLTNHKNRYSVEMVFNPFA